MRTCLLCSDMDRTLIPNGSAPDSPGALQIFTQLMAQPEITLTYVTGRHLALIDEAIGEFNLPRPDFAIADVGSTIYTSAEEGWKPWPSWSREIGADWGGMDGEELHELLADIPELSLQEADKQGRYKLSYELPLDADALHLSAMVKSRLMGAGIRVGLIHSVDEQAGIGLLDVLPAKANKRHAIEFLMRKQGFGYDNTVFAGDSGNDLDVMLSPIHAILVANAGDEVRAAARSAPAQTLYLARGGFLGMNGNYSAGVLEGVAHYMPDVRIWLEKTV